MCIRDRPLANVAKYELVLPSQQKTIQYRPFLVKEEKVLLMAMESGESKEMTVRIVIPDNQEVGAEVNTPLSMCVGMGDERQCSEILINFISTGSIMLPPHQRSVPSTGLNWEMIADIPLTRDNLSWSISEAGMAIPGWVWSSSGAVEIEGDILKISGTSGERVNGTLSLNLPNNSPPAFHSFSDTISQNIGFSLSFSLEILQIHRAGLEITYPDNQPYLIDVREEFEIEIPDDAAEKIQTIKDAIDFIEAA